MSKLTKKIAIGVGAFFGVLIIALIGASIYLSTLIDEDFIVKQMESAMNCRVEIKDLNVGLFSAVSSIGLEGVKLGPRDSYANKGVPQKDRKPMKNAILEAGSIELALQFGPLLKKKFVLDKFVIDEPVLNLVIYASGGNNLNPLFRTPRIVDGKRNPALDKKPEPKEKEEPAPSKESKPFTAADIPVAGSLKKIGLTNATVNVLLQSSRNLITVTGLDLLLTDIDIDGQNLKEHNSAKLRLDANVLLQSPQKKPKAKLLLRSNARIVPFDAKTGKVNPAITYKLVVKEGSKLYSFAALDQLAGSLPILKKIGLKMDGLSKEATLLEDVEVLISYSRSLLRILNQPTFKTKRYDLAVGKRSWIRLSNSTHKLDAKILASAEESKKGLAHVDKEIQKAVKGDAANAKLIRDKLLGSLVENDRIYLKFVSKGSLSNPQVVLLSNVPSISDLISGSIKSAVNNRLKNELRKVPGGKKAGELIKKLF